MNEFYKDEVEKFIKYTFSELYKKQDEMNIRYRISEVDIMCESISKSIDLFNNEYFKQLITGRMEFYTKLKILPEDLKQDILVSTGEYIKNETRIFKLGVKERQEKPEVKYQRHALFVSCGALVISLIAVVISLYK